MKIALVCPYNMVEHSGGVQEIIRNLANQLRERRHIVKIITPRPMGYKGEAPAGIIFLGRSRRLNGTLSTVLDLGIEVDGDEITKVLDQEKFDVINFHEPWYPVLPRQIASRSNSAAHVATFHAILPDSVAAKSIVNLLMPYGRSITEKMHLLTATSPAAAEVLFHKGGGKVRLELLETIKYIPCAVDLNYYKPLKQKSSLSGPGTKTIVYIGRPDKRKGLDCLIKAFSVLVASMPEAHLVIAGAGDRMKVLQKQVKDEKIPNVKFMGRVTDEEKRRLLGNADLTCFPSLYGEGFGIVLMESMAMGNFPLAGNNPGYRNVMKGDGLIGLVSPEAIEDFVNRLEVFLSSEKLSNVMNEWAINEVRQYGYDKVVTQYESAYKEAMAIYSRENTKEDSHAQPPRKNLRWFGLRRHAR